MRRQPRVVTACDPEGRPCGVDARDPYLAWADLEGDIQSRGSKKDPQFRLGLEGSWKKFRYLTQEGFDVYEVDGEWIRNNLSVIFGHGGHGLVHEFIPMDEVWIATRHFADCGCQKDSPNAPMTQEDFNLTLLHELTEHKHMRNGLSYFEAHVMASQREDDAKEPSASRVASAYLNRQAAIWQHK